MYINKIELKRVLQESNSVQKQAGAAVVRNIAANSKIDNTGLTRDYEAKQAEQTFIINKAKAALLAEELLNPNTAIEDIFKKDGGLITLSNEHANSFGQALQESVNKIVKGSREEAGNRLRLASQMFANQSTQNPHAKPNIFATMLTDLADRVSPIPSYQRGSIYGDIFSQNK